MFSASRKPGNGADQTDDTNSSTSIVHRVLGDGVCSGEVECDGSKEQKDEAHDV